MDGLKRRMSESRIQPVMNQHMEGGRGLPRPVGANLTSKKVFFMTSPPYKILNDQAICITASATLGLSNITNSYLF